MTRSITFTIEDQSETRLTITEMEDGSLLFEIESLGIHSDDLRALFFDIGDSFEGLLDGLSVTGGDVNGTQFEANDVSDLGQGANVNGWIVNRYGEFDAGIEFGTPGGEGDVITSTSFILSHDTEALDLDMIDEQDFAVRTTAAGDKAVGRSSAAILAVDDTVRIDENSVSLLSNLLTNDRYSDGLLITSAGHEGNPLALGGWNTLTTASGRSIDIFLAVDGSFQVDATNSEFDTLALGETDTITISYASEDAASSTDTATVTITITGQNDAPVALGVTGDA
ncbi:VCBS domain-containing protein, partial [Aurantiacibacter hainanensis]|uniref:VCBS domain-containing protein n=1 Tax=Aurantiacibacter hainanensis TaxID=3076114 RepID=UPI0030C6CB3D